MILSYHLFHCSPHHSSPIPTCYDLSLLPPPFLTAMIFPLPLPSLYDLSPPFLPTMISLLPLPYPSLLWSFPYPSPIPPYYAISQYLSYLPLVTERFQGRGCDTVGQVLWWKRMFKNITLSEIILTWQINHNYNFSNGRLSVMPTLAILVFYFEWQIAIGSCSYIHWQWDEWKSVQHQSNKKWYRWAGHLK